MKNHYQTLGLQEGASQEDIQGAYERLSHELDPTNNDNEEFFAEELQKVEDAYKALSNSTILATKKGVMRVEVSDSSQIGKKSTDPKKSVISAEEKKSLYKKLKKLSLIQNLIIVLFILSLGFNFYLLGQIKGEDSAAKMAESHASKAKTYMNDSKKHMNDAYNYSIRSEGYMNDAEDYMNDAYYYSNN
jgi:hypothetical protein